MLVSSDLSYFVHLILPDLFLRLEFTLHTLLVARSDKPWTSFAGGNQNFLCAQYA